VLLVPLVDLVVEEVHMDLLLKVLVEMEILHQHHHHKEILVVKVQIQMELVVVALDLQVLVIRQLLPDLVDLVQHLLFLGHQ
jgi:hypothetical protein